MSVVGNSINFQVSRAYPGPEGKFQILLKVILYILF